MDLKSIFEKVNLIVPVEQRRFFNLFDDTVRELEASYGDFLFEKGKVYDTPNGLDDFCPVRPLFAPAIVDNILFNLSGGENYKTEFIRKAQEAYLKYWNDNAKGRTFGGAKGRVW